MDGARAVTAETETATCETHLVLAATTRLADCAVTPVHPARLNMERRVAIMSRQVSR